MYGGKDRTVDMTKLIQFLDQSNIENIICLPDTGNYIAQNLKNYKKKNVFQTQTLKEAVKIAKLVTKKDMICLLSPAASSYGFFKDFKERGNLFKELVKE